MSGISQIFLGITVVGLIMTVKVVMDGLQALTVISDKIAAFQEATRQCKIHTDTKVEESKEAEEKLQEITAEVEKLTVTEKEMGAQVRALRADLDRNKSAS